MISGRRDPKLDALRRVPLFEGLSKADFAALAKVTDAVDLSAGRRLFKEGEIGDEFFILISGTADVTAKGKHLMTCGPGDYLGDISLIVRSPRRASAVATTDIRAFVMTRSNFAALLKSTPGVELKVLRSLAQRVLDSSNRPTL